MFFLTIEDIQDKLPILGGLHLSGWEVNHCNCTFGDSVFHSRFDTFWLEIIIHNFEGLFGHSPRGFFLLLL